MVRNIFMGETVLTFSIILDAAEAAIRRFGPEKTSVLDVARALGVSHGALYRHFDGKAQLTEAVVARWLERLGRPLAVIAAETNAAAERLRRWFDVLIASQLAKARNDPDLFAAFAASARRKGAAFAGELDRRRTHVAKIIDDGARQGAFRVIDPPRTATAILDATVRHHHPLHSSDWSEPETALEFDAVFALLLRGLAR